MTRTFAFPSRTKRHFQALRILAYVTFALAPVGIARAGVGVMSGDAFSSLRHFAPMQTVQSNGCWYDNGWNGPGYYPCGDEWNSRPDAAGTVAPIIIPAVRTASSLRRRRCASPRPEPGLSRRAVRSRPRTGAPVFGGASGQRRFGAAGVHMPNSHSGAATVTPGFIGGRFHSGLGGGNSDQFHGAGVPHVGIMGVWLGGERECFHWASVFPILVCSDFLVLGGCGLQTGPGVTGVTLVAGFTWLCCVGTFHASAGSGASHIGVPIGVHGVVRACVRGGGAALRGGRIGHR